MAWCHKCEDEYSEGIENCPVCGSKLSDEIPPSKMPKPKLGWSFKRAKGTSPLPEWPKDDKGENVPAAFLINIGGTQIDYDLALSVLRAFNIPYACELPGSGQFTTIYMGFSGGGMNIYVPETMLEEAENILSADTEEQE